MNARRPPGSALVIWRFSDGRRGHDTQSRGLVQALARRMPCRVRELPAGRRFAALLALAAGRFPAGAALPDPDLLVGAGHATHLPMLAARRARGGRAIVLMQPSLPAAWFDCCLIPEHDGPGHARNIIPTRGPLNTVTPGSEPRDNAGLILVGGPSRHFHFDTSALLDQVRSVCGDRSLQWTITDSPRTPEAARRALRSLASPGIDFVSHADTAPGWIAPRLARAQRAWVTCDSLSMIYEALTAGTAVAVFTMPVRRHGRVSRAVERLVRDRQVTSYHAWQDGVRPAAPMVPLDEAARCAALLLERLA